MIVLEKHGLIRCGCGTIYTFAQELVEKIFPILDYDITVCFNDRYFTVNKYNSIEDIVQKWSKEETK